MSSRLLYLFATPKPTDVIRKLAVTKVQTPKMDDQVSKPEATQQPWQPQAEEEIRNGGAKGHSGAVILHFSGCGVKPWDLIFSRFLTNLAGDEPWKV